jgi:YidC/Oxa1 family membrane protein insertase
VNPLGGCLPVLVQVPVFIGLFHVLREFEPGKTQNYIFGAAEVESFNAASLFGAKLGAWVTMGADQLEALGTSMANMIIVMIPLMIAAGVFTHITARHSVARQTEAQAANPQSAIMNKLMLYVFPIGVVVGAPFLPLAVLSTGWPTTSGRSASSTSSTGRSTPKRRRRRHRSSRIGKLALPVRVRSRPAPRPLLAPRRPRAQSRSPGVRPRTVLRPPQAVTARPSRAMRSAPR